jgi:hypothetical protein
VQSRDAGRGTRLSATLNGRGGHEGEAGDTSSDIVITAASVLFVVDIFCNKYHLIVYDVQVGLREIY